MLCTGRKSPLAPESWPSQSERFSRCLQYFDCGCCAVLTEPGPISLQSILMWRLGVVVWYYCILKLAQCTWWFQCTSPWPWETNRPSDTSACSPCSGYLLRYWRSLGSPWLTGHNRTPPVHSRGTQRQTFLLLSITFKTTFITFVLIVRTFMQNKQCINIVNKMINYPAHCSWWTELCIR